MFKASPSFDITYKLPRKLNQEDYMIPRINFPNLEGDLEFVKREEYMLKFHFYVTQIDRDFLIMRISYF